MAGLVTTGLIMGFFGAWIISRAAPQETMTYYLLPIGMALCAGAMIGPRSEASRGEETLEPNQAPRDTSPAR